MAKCNKYLYFRPGYEKNCIKNKNSEKIKFDIIKNTKTDIVPHPSKTFSGFDPSSQYFPLH